MHFIVFFCIIFKKKKKIIPLRDEVQLRGWLMFNDKVASHVTWGHGFKPWKQPLCKAGEGCMHQPSSEPTSVELLQPLGHAF